MKWNLELNNLGLGGFAPAYWENSYPSYGNKNMAARMRNCSLIDHNIIEQGPSLENLTDGSEAGLLTSIIEGIWSYSKGSASEPYSFAIGPGVVYRIDHGTEIKDDSGKFPHIIADAQEASYGLDIAVYLGKLLYICNTNSSDDVGLGSTTGNTWDDDWGSTVPSGKNTLEADVPHQICVGGNNHAYITNGYYVADVSDANNDSTPDTINVSALDLPSDYEIQSIKWFRDRLYILANMYGTISDNTRSVMSLFVWDGNDDSWEEQPIMMSGVGGALYVLNGNLYIFYYDPSYTNDGGCKLAYLDGNSLVEVAQWDGSVPKFYQVTDYNNFLIFVSGSRLWAWGSNSIKLQERLFQFMDGGYEDVGGIAAPFDNLLVASSKSDTFTAAVDDVITCNSHGLSNGDTIVVNSSGTLPAGLSENTTYYVINSTTDTFKVSTTLNGNAVNITNTGSSTHTWYRTRLGQISGYETDSYWHSLLFDVTGEGRKSVIDKIQFCFDKLATGARCDWVLKNNAGTTIESGTISYAGDGAITYKEMQSLAECDNFRLELNWANGSATNPVSFRSIKIYGHTIK